MKTPQSPAVIRKGSFEMASTLPANAAGHHHQPLPSRIILSTKNRNQSIAVKQDPVGDASPASMMTTGCAIRKAIAHQAPRSPTYSRPNWKNGQMPARKKNNETTFAQPYHSEPVILNSAPAAAGALFKITGSEWYGWANVVSLFFFLAGIWPFFQLGREYVGERGAWWATAFLIAQPVGIMLAGEASPTGSCLTAMLWFLFFVDRMIREGNGWWWWPAALAGSVLAISKLPFLMTAGLCGVFILLIHRTRSWKPWLLLAAAGAVAALIFFAWTRYADSLAAQAEYPYVELRLSQS